MLYSQSVAPAGQVLSEDTVAQTLAAGLAGRFANQRVLVLIPDFTRSLPMPLLFRLLVDTLQDVKAARFYGRPGDPSALEPGAPERTGRHLSR